MGQIKQEQIGGVVRNNNDKEAREKGGKEYTAVMNDGRRVQLDKGEMSSLANRLDKDRSRMEKEGTREREREPEKRPQHRVASEAQQRAFMQQFQRKQR